MADSSNYAEEQVQSQMCKAQGPVPKLKRSGVVVGLGVDNPKSPAAIAFKQRGLCKVSTATSKRSTEAP